MSIQNRVAEQGWIGVLELLREKISQEEVETWLLPLEPSQGAANRLVLTAPYSIFAAHVKRKYGSDIEKAAPCKVVFVASERPFMVDYQHGWRKKLVSRDKITKRRAGGFTEQLRPKTNDCGPPPLPEGIEDSLEAILAYVVGEFNVSRSELLGRDKARRITAPRHALAYLGRKYTSAPYTILAQVLGDRNHSSIMRSIEKAEALLRDDPIFRGKMESVEANFSPQV